MQGKVKETLADYNRNYPHKGLKIKSPRKDKKIAKRLVLTGFFESLKYYDNKILSIDV